MRHQASNIGMVFLTGLAAGYVASLLIPKDVQLRNRNRLMKMKKVLTDPDEQERIMDIFKDRTDEAVTSFQMAKDRLARNLSEMQNKFSDISKDKYIEAVEDALDYVAEYQELPTPQFNALKKYLEGDFRRIKSSLQTSN